MSQQTTGGQDAAPCWVPTDLVWLDDRPVAVLQPIARPTDPEPFWLQQIGPLRGQVRLQPLDTIRDHEHVPGPAGFLFHMSRCGSTLACMLLGSFPQAVALAEPLVFHSLLLRASRAGLRAERLRRLMALHTAALCAPDQRLVIKWSSTMCRQMDVLAEAFPDVPRVFVHRDPVEVLASGVSRPSPAAAAIDSRDIAPHLAHGVRDQRALPLDERWARFVASCCFHAAESDAVALVDYDQLPQIAWGALAAEFGLPAPSPSTLLTLRERCEVHAKHRGRPFVPDGAGKRAAIPDGLRDLAARLIVPERERLMARHPRIDAPARERRFAR